MTHNVDAKEVKMASGKSSVLVDPAWLHRRRNDPRVKVIEIAGTGQEQMQAYKAGHIPGAVCWLWKDMLWDSHRRDFPAPDDFARRCGAAGISNDTTVIFYGEGVQFGFYAWWTFRYCGHKNIKMLDGTRYRWAAEGRPLVTDEPPAASPVEYKPGKRVERMRIHRDKVLTILRKESALFLDGRSPEEYRGERVGGPGSPDEGALRYGRKPGAKPVLELQKLFETRGAGPDRDIIAYCRMSHRATVLYFALTQLLGYKNVKIYDGSWTEWGNLVGVPVER